MNNSADSNTAFPFNFSTSSAYCQNISAAPQLNRNTSDQSSNNGSQHSAQEQPPQQQQLEGGGFDANMNLVQSLFQTCQQQQQSNACAAAGLSSSSSSGGGGAMNTTSQYSTWQSCRFCQSKMYGTNERLLEHEISCPMHLQLQNFLQQQQMTPDALSAQLQMQQNQLQQQFNKVSQQVQAPQQNMQQGQQGLDSYNMSNLFSNSMGQFGNMSNNPFQATNDLQAQASQNQGLSSMLQQQQQQQNNAIEQQFQAPAPIPSHSSSTVSNTAEDQFESAINRLPDFSEPKPLTSSTPSSSTDYFPLAMAEDDEWLTPLHCFVRKYCVEVFVATPADVAAPCMGKRNPVSVNQVGIRCPYCSPERMGPNETVDVSRARENGVVYPSLIGRIYNSSINLLQRHLRSCAFVPPQILARYEDLKSSNARSGASKKYWADSATRLGLMDTPEGIRLDKEAHNAHVQAQANSGKKSPLHSEAEAPPLVLPSDKRNTTAFTFHLMSQMQPCVFTEADRLGRRRGLDVGFAGLACRHCFGVYGSGRFFPSSVKTMADASKTLDVIYRHVMKCKKCPSDIRGGLRNLRDFHDSERSKMPFGNQRAFFVKIWGRLHEGTAAELPALHPAPAPSMTAIAATAAMVPMRGLPKSDVGTPGGDSIQGLFSAMVKRESDHNQDHQENSMNKLATEAA
ncbi:hypothetical protein ACHAXR_006100 [Thalassiosira sp. AJA248-18]